MTDQRKIVCPDHPDTELENFISYGAPGIGWSARCPINDKEWSVIGGFAFEPDEELHIGTAADFR